MNKPQKYVRNSGLRDWDFVENDEGVPSWGAITGCVLLACVVAIMGSVIYGA